MLFRSGSPASHVEPGKAADKQGVVANLLGVQTDAGSARQEAVFRVFGPDLGRGLRFLSGKDLNRDGKQEGFAALMVRGQASKEQRWFRVRIRALAQDDFRVALDDLYLRIDFFRDGGTNSLDHVKQSLYELVERDRKA